MPLIRVVLSALLARHHYHSIAFLSTRPNIWLSTRHSAGANHGNRSQGPWGYLVTVTLQLMALGSRFLYRWAGQTNVNCTRAAESRKRTLYVYMLCTGLQLLHYYVTRNRQPYHTN